MILFQCVIPARPGILKNGKRIFRNRHTGRAFITSSEKYAIWEKMASLYIQQERNRQGTETIDFPVNLKCEFYFKNHQHEPDLSNCYQGIEDVLQKQKIISDDKLIYSHDGSRKIFEGNTDRIVITITQHDKKFQSALQQQS